MSSAVGLNRLHPSIPTSNTEASSPPATQHSTTDKTSLEINKITLGKDHETSPTSPSDSHHDDLGKTNINSLSKTREIANTFNESDANHNSEQSEGKFS